MPGLQELLKSYLNDHLAAASAGVALFRRTAAAHAGTDLGVALAELTEEVAADRRALLDIMVAVGVTPSTAWTLAGRAAERIGRLKPNATLLRRSPLTDVVEMEGLRIAVLAKAAGWETLRAAAVEDDRLSRVGLEELLERAYTQADRLRTLHLQVAQVRFAETSSRQRPDG